MQEFIYEKKLLLNHVLISGTKALIINDYYKKLPAFTDKYTKIKAKIDAAKGANIDLDNVISLEKESDKVFKIVNTGTAFYGSVKWLIYKNLLINDDWQQLYLLIANRLYDHSELIRMHKKITNKIINLYNNFIFVK